MKNLFIFIVLFSCLSSTYAQIGIKANGTAPIASAQLEVQSTTKAFYPPRMSTSEKGLIGSPQAGAVVYDNNLGALSFYNGSTWVTASGGAGLTLPYSQTGNDASSNGLFKITENGTNVSGRAISGISNAGFGIIGTSTSGTGVRGTSTSFIGVAGSSTNAIGVYGSSDTNYGVNGSSNTGDGGVFSSTSGRALRTIGRISFSGTGVGTLGTGKFLKSINNAGDAEWSDFLPLAITQSSGGTLFNIVNSSTSGGFAITGNHNGTGGVGVSGNADIGTGTRGGTFTGVGIEGFAYSSGVGGFFSSSSGYALITAGGSVGIGLYNPNEILDVNGRVRIRHNPGYSSGVWMSNSTNSLNGADGAFYGMKTDTETGFYIGNAWRFWVTNTGNATLLGTLTQTSDKRLKKDFKSLTNSLSSLSKLNGYHYYWKEESRSHDLQTGVIAQEVEKIFPELVNKDEKGFLSVNYIGLVPHLIEAVKELSRKNEALQITNERIEAKVSEMQNLKNRLEKLEALLLKTETEKSVSEK